MYTREDAEREAAESAWIDEITEQAITEFRGGRLVSYYEQNPSVVVPGAAALADAVALTGLGHHGYAVTAAVISIEIYTKFGMLRPIVYGLVHSEGLADLIMTAAVPKNGMNRLYRSMLNPLSKVLLKLDLETFGTEGNSNLLRDLERLQDERNRVVHAGDRPNANVAAHAIATANLVIEKLWQPMLKKLGLVEVDGLITSPLAMDVWLARDALSRRASSDGLEDADPPLRGGAD